MAQELEEIISRWLQEPSKEAMTEERLTGLCRELLDVADAPYLLAHYRRIVTRKAEVLCRRELQGCFNALKATTQKRAVAQLHEFLERGGEALLEGHIITGKRHDGGVRLAVDEFLKQSRIPWEAARVLRREDELFDRLWQSMEEAIRMAHDDMVHSLDAAALHKELSGDSVLRKLLQRAELTFSYSLKYARQSVLDYIP